MSGGILLGFLIAIFDVSAAKLFSLGRGGIGELWKCIWFDDPSRLLHSLRIPCSLEAVKSTEFLQYNNGCFKLVFLILILAPTVAYCTECPSSIYDHVVNTEGALQFPVFHREHACAQESIGHLRPTEDTMKLDINVTRQPEINSFAYLMPLKIGTPPIWNLVAFDTGSTLSFVQCEPCTVRCHEQKAGAGQIFDPTKSKTFGRVGCSTQQCIEVQRSLRVSFQTKACVELEDTCLYAMTYGAGKAYSAGKLVTDKITLGPNDVAVMRGFVFGCSLDTEYNNYEAGIMGFGWERFSLFMQVSRLVGYKAFSYCFPSDKKKPGYLAIGNYSRVGSSYSTQLLKATDRPMYSLELGGISVNGINVETSSEMIVDTGSEYTFLLSDTFNQLDNAVTPALEALGYKQVQHTTDICFENSLFTTFKNWSALPVVELSFSSRAKLRLPPQNVFYIHPSFGLCTYFSSDEAGVKGKQILGSSITKSFGVTFDIEGGQFVFRDGDC